MKKILCAQRKMKRKYGKPNKNYEFHGIHILRFMECTQKNRQFYNFSKILLKFKKKL